MIIERYQHSATLLQDGRVLVIGGCQFWGRVNYPHEEYSVTNVVESEIFNPAKGEWSTSARLRNGRSGHAAIFLPGGEVLVVGGDGGGNTVESYLLVEENFIEASNLNLARSGFTATFMQRSQVMVTGGFSSDILDSTEIYTPVSRTWYLIGKMNVARRGHSATLLRDGRVLVVGGFY
jgi:N-acetylneuraminic acid mutarotase